MWQQIAADRWCKCADAGHIYVPRDLTGDADDAVIAALRLALLAQPKALHLYINTVNGTSCVWEMARMIEHLNGQSIARVTHEAFSAGLVLAVACKHRTCVQRAKFLYHGIDCRHPETEDERRAKWFAERTTADVEFWMQKAGEGDYQFGADEALALGVVHEVVG